MRMFIEERASLLRDGIFAASDGIVTTFAVVAGSAGASLSSNIVLILGFANLFADGISMASGNYLGVKSELEYEKVKSQNTTHQASPFMQGLMTFSSFNLAGFIPLFPYVFNMPYSLTFSTIFVGISLFTVGTIRSKFTEKDWFRSGMETLLIGGFSAVIAFTTGEILKRLVS